MLGDLKIDDERSLDRVAQSPSAIDDGGQDGFSAVFRTQHGRALTARQVVLPASARCREPVRLSCKGVFTPCCNTLEPAIYCRQCALLCAVEPNATDDGLALHTQPWHSDLASCVPGHITQQHTGMFLVSRGIQLLECDSRATSFFTSTDIFKVVARDLHCTNATVHEHFAKAVRATLKTGNASHVLVYANAQPQRRYCLILFRVSRDEIPELRGQSLVLAVIQPLDARRVATAQQLMEIFGLSAAEARLVRALARGESLEYFAAAQGTRITTARSQLRSAFSKTATDRQAELVRLVIGIPPIRC